MRLYARFEVKAQWNPDSILLFSLFITMGNPDFLDYLFSASLKS